MRALISVFLLATPFVAINTHASVGCNTQVQLSVQKAIDDTRPGETITADLPDPSQMPDQQYFTILVPARDYSKAMVEVYQVGVSETCQIMSVTRGTFGPKCQ